MNRAHACLIHAEPCEPCYDDGCRCYGCCRARSIANRARREHRMAERRKLTNPCELVLTMNRGSNGRLIVVRCRCMALYGASRRNYNYDHLGIVSNLAEVRALWAEHRKEST